MSVKCSENCVVGSRQDTVRPTDGEPDAVKVARPVRRGEQRKRTWNTKQRALLLPNNRYQNRIKILFWDRDGFCIWYKRLERGVFEMPAGGQAGVELDYKQLSRLLGGLDLRSGRRRQRRYRRVVQDNSRIGLP
jgi:transposase